MSYSSLKQRRLYNVLGVSPTCSTEELRKVYHTLAAKYHPDRQGPESSESKFKEVQAAYEVLKDESKRKTYDRYGDESLRFINDDTGYTPLLGLGPQVMAAAACCVLIPIILTIIFMSLNIDGKVSWSWAVTFIPFWIVSCCVVVDRLTLIRKEIAMSTKVVAIFRPILPIIFVLLLSFQLDGVMNTWGIVFIPLVLSCFLELAITWQMTFESYEATCVAVGSFATRSSFNALRAWSVFGQIRNLTFILLLVLKLTKEIDVSYVIVGMPFWIGFGLSFCFHYMMKRLIPEYLASGSVSICGTLIAFTVFLLIFLKADGADYSMAVALIPIWIALGVCCCMACGLCFLQDGNFSSDAGPPPEYQATDEIVPTPAPVVVPIDSVPAEDLHDID